MQTDKKVMLMILDGWGFGKHDHSNAVEASNTPFINSLRLKPFAEYLEAILTTQSQFTVTM